ncbi:MAG TPA: 50S ribosomal protein L6 [Candidatus Paceibacterota bacterium]|nr:50S ribosomal protein L6 [Candidatus Paceibacterota bacterium]
MSRLIKKPIAIASGATLAKSGETLVVKGPKGQLTVKIPAGVDVKIEGTNFTVEAKGDGASAFAGTFYALVKNAIVGVTDGFTKVLEIEGVGYRAAIEGKTLVLHLGYAQPVRRAIPEGIAVAVEKNVIKISGIDKETVGQAAAEIRSLKKPEPYKGKGIHYQGEVIRRKVGKKAGATAAA